MALIEGETLDRLIPPDGLPVSRLLDLAIPLADALGAAHERGVVHRDLKPGNIMVRPDGPRGTEERDPMIVFATRWPGLTSTLRRHARFPALLEKLGVRD